MPPIVEPHAAILMEKFMEAQTSFAKLPEKEQPSHMGEDSRTYVDWMVDYVCRHRVPVKLLLHPRGGDRLRELCPQYGGG